MHIIIHKYHYWVSGTKNYKKKEDFFNGQKRPNEQFRGKTEVKKWSLLDVTPGPRDTEERRREREGKAGPGSVPD